MDRTKATSCGMSSSIRVSFGSCIIRAIGAFCFGRTHTRLHPDGHQTFVKLAPEEWTALIRDAHEGYITWDQFEQNVLWARNERKARRAKVLLCCKAWRYVHSVESE